MTEPHDDPRRFDRDYPAGGEVPLTQQTSGMAITGLVLGVFGLCFFPLGIAALVLGIVALSRIADPARALTGKGIAITATVLGGLSITLVPVILMIAILLPALGAARRAARQMQNTAQVRGIVQGLVTYGGGNGGYYPGIDEYGNPVDLTVENRFWVMLDNNIFTGEYLISPSETKTIWQSGPLTTANYSFALSDVSDKGGRRDEWWQSINTMAITISDRNTGTSGANADVMSVHTGPPGHWAGSVGRNDGSTSFENIHELDVQYGKGQKYLRDNIFEMTGTDDAMMIYSGD